jgi:Flp pilus assembly protein TadG
MPRQLLRRLISSRDGSVILETAIMITILLMLMFGIVDLGRVLFTESNLVSAAREGARYGAVDQSMFATSTPDTLAVKDTVINHFSPFGGTALTRANIATTLVGSPNSSIRVTIKYRFNWITPIRNLVGAMRDTLHAQAEFRLETGST